MRALPWIVSALLLPVTASAQTGPGTWVGISVEVDGRTTPLYPAPDGSGRYYLEARAGAPYTVRLANRTRERLGVILSVDGLNVVSGEPQAASAPGRMYVLDPWDARTVRGWRSSLDDVQRFTFVDERGSYAVRSGKATGKLGWIEVAVYRERRPYVFRYGDDYGPRKRRAPREEPWDERAESRERGEADAPSAAQAPESKSRDDSARAEGLGRRDGFAPGEPAPYPAPSYPGTGWGPRMEDPVSVVRFDPEPRPVECLTLRYEYAPALRALGILPRPWAWRDRLSERENGFATPPIW